MIEHQHASEYEVLESVAPEALRLMREHEKKQILWLPSELLLGAVPIRIDPQVLASYILNLLTEEGLTSFHTLLSSHLGEHDVWADWTALWTAEEDRHGAVLHDALRYIVNIRHGAVEQMQYAYLRAGGFRPSWGGGPYELLAYTVLQERATQISHGNMARALKGTFLAPIFGRIAGEEWKHCCFYRSVFREVLKKDPTKALPALEKTMRDFYMPGKSIPGFGDLAYVAMRSKMFDGFHYKDIVMETIEYLDLTSVSGLDALSEESRTEILRMPARLVRIAERFSASRERTLAFSFLAQDSTFRI